jgi:hypothetical protein
MNSDISRLCLSILLLAVFEGKADWKSKEAGKRMG